MSNKYFRFHEGTPGDHWVGNNCYSQQEIDSIEDPCGNNSTKQITSIPSPFARIDLVLSAFKQVGKDIQHGGVGITGNTIFHRMVSEALDVAEIFYQKSEMCTVIEWDRERSIAELIGSGNSHRRLGETFRLFLNGTNSYNFNNTRHPFTKLFFINYNDKIIGGISPATLFFGSSIGNRERIEIFLTTPKKGMHRVFDPKHFVPFHERDKGFIKWMLTIKAVMPDFNVLFPEVNNYIAQCVRLLSENDKAEMRAFSTATNWDDENIYETIYSEDGAGSPVRILDFDIKKSVRLEVVGSDFQINSTICNDKLLVLPNGKDSRGLNYSGAAWGEHYQISQPKTEDGTLIPINDRELPYDGRKCPYVTIDDIFEPHIVKTVFPINREAYYDGNYSTECSFADNEQRGYLLPLKKEILKYLTPAEIQNNIKITESGKGNSVIYVKVSFDIPIQKGKKIRYEKLYTYPSPEKLSTVNPSVNEKGEGQVIQYRFNALLYSKYLAADAPNFIKMGVLAYNNCLQEVSPVEFIYKGVDIYKDDKGKTYSTFRSESRTGDDFCSLYYSIDSRNFNAIQINLKSISALLLPQFEYKSTNNANCTYTFAVDFGTSNTHIEYNTNNDISAKALTYNDYLLTLHKSHWSSPDLLKLLDIIPKEFVPEKLGERFCFPQRSVIAYNNVTVMNYKALCDFNIFFGYEKTPHLTGTNIRTDIKWANYGKAEGDDESGLNDCIVSAYIEQIMLMIRNKVIAEGGNLANTKIRWFYPVSMDTQRRDSLKTKWEKFYGIYFNPRREARANVVRITESVSPYFYYNLIRGMGAMGRGAVTIDIGGGTTDITMFGIQEGGHNAGVRNITSFRFAANALFGDGYKQIGSNTNGFIQKYWERIYRLILQIREGENEIYPIKTTFAQILNVTSTQAGGSESYQISPQDSNKIINFLFSLAGRYEGVSLGEEIFKDSDMKLVPLIFYSSIVYHTAKMMRNLGYDIPDYLLFSGTGSKVLDLIATTPEGLNDYTKAIFAKVYNISSERENKLIINLQRENNPKELCCKGGLYGADGVAGENMNEKITILINNRICKSALSTEETADDYRYSHLTDNAVKQAVLEDVKECLQTISYVLNQRGFASALSTSAMWINDALDILDRKGVQFLNEGIAAKNKERPTLIQDPKLEEPLFFYPLIGLINELAFTIAQRTINNTTQN